MFPAPLGRAAAAHGVNPATKARVNERPCKNDRHEVADATMREACRATVEGVGRGRAVGAGRGRVVGVVGAGEVWDGCSLGPPPLRRQQYAAYCLNSGKWET